MRKNSRCSRKTQEYPKKGIFPNEFEEKASDLNDKKKTKLSQGERGDELSGKLKSQDKEQKLMHSVLENDQDSIDFGKLLADSINQNVGSFTPDLMFEQLVKNYAMAKKLFGETLIRYVSGYDPEYVQRNVKIPEFARELEKNIKDRIEKLKKEGLIDKQGAITEDGLTLASLVTYVEELDKLEPRGFFGEKTRKRISHYGIGEEVRNFRKGDTYHDIAVRKTIKTAARRMHKKVEVSDLKTFEKKSKAHIYLIYGLDASGSMKGDKISLSKKAGIALAYKAIQEKDKVGLIAFGTEIKDRVLPTGDFMRILRTITSVRASMETNISETIREAVKMFPETDVTKHLILLTDALPTTGKDPQKEVLDEVATAKNAGVTISVVGINLDNKGKELAEKIVELGHGRLYICKDVQELDQIVLEDYYSL